MVNTNKHVVPHLRLTWGGTLGVPAVEIWSNTLAMVQDLTTPAGDEVPSESEIKALVIAMAPVVQTWFTAPDSIIGNAAQLSWLKAAWVLNTGKQRDTNTAIYDYAPGVFGASATPPIWEQTYALTLRTPLTRGRGHAGRIYPPLNGQTPSGKTPYMDGASAAGMSDRFAACLGSLIAKTADVLNGGETGPRILFPAIVSVGDTEAGLPALTNFITRVVCDRVADIQHRRTNRVPRNEAAESVLFPEGEGGPGQGDPNAGQIVIN